MIYLQLFFAFATIGLFNFGGGYAMISLIQKAVVENHAWLTAGEFTNMVAIAESTPGPLAINTATYAGFKVAGIGGAAVANLGILTPALIIIILLAAVLIKYENHWSIRGILAGLAPVTIGLILSAAVLLADGISISWGALLIAVIAFSLSMWSKVHPVLIIVGLGLLGMILI